MVLSANRRQGRTPGPGGGVGEQRRAVECRLAPGCGARLVEGRQAGWVGFNLGGHALDMSVSSCEVHGEQEAAYQILQTGLVSKGLPLAVVSATQLPFIL